MRGFKATCPPPSTAEPSPPPSSRGVRERRSWSRWGEVSLGSSPTTLEVLGSNARARTSHTLEEVILLSPSSPVSLPAPSSPSLPPSPIAIQLATSFASRARRGALSSFTAASTSHSLPFVAHRVSRKNPSRWRLQPSVMTARGSREGAALPR